MADIYELWGRTVKDAVSRYARHQSKEIREDYEQECLVLVLEIEDAVQKIVSEQGMDAGRNYIYAACHNRITKMSKADSKYTSHVALDDYKIADEIETHGLAHQTDFGVSEQDLDEAVKQLPRVEQHIVRSLYFHSMTEEALAKSLGKTKWWVQQVKKDAIAQLRTILESK